MVNNYCTDNTGDVVRRHMLADTIPNLRTVQEPEQGLTPARLRGVRNSSAKWIAFVDDDCFLRPDWIAQAITFTESHPRVGAFGGKLVLDWGIEPPPFVRGHGYSFAEQNHGDSQHQGKFLAGAGLVVNRSALSECGWLDRPLLADRIGKSLMSGGHVEIVLCVCGAGYELWYVPECEFHHEIPARRISQRYLRDINRSLGASQVMAYALVSERSSFQWFFASVFKAAKQTLGLVPLMLETVFRSKAPAEISIQGSFVLGELLGIWKILRMKPPDRLGLLGRARRFFSRKLSRPGAVA